jgi:hypothetical protein
VSPVIAELTGCDDIGCGVLPSVLPGEQVLCGAPKFHVPGAFGRTARKFVWRSRPHEDTAVEAPPMLMFKSPISKVL